MPEAVSIVLRTGWAINGRGAGTGGEAMTGSIFVSGDFIIPGLGLEAH